jgi:hypothetical protein
MRRLLPGSLLVVAVAAACGGSSEPADADGLAGDAGVPEQAEPVSHPVITLPHEPQREGDPEKGYRALVNEPYVPCGIPWTAYAQVFGPAPEGERVSGREGRNEILPFGFTAMTTEYLKTL